MSRHSWFRRSYGSRHGAAGRPLAYLIPIVVVGLGVAFAVFLGQFLLAPPRFDLQVLAVSLSFSSLGSLAAAHTLLSQLERTRFARLSIRLLLIPFLAVGISLINIFMTAFLMFFNAHDFRLLILLQIFSLLIALCFTVSVSLRLTSQIQQLVTVATRLAAGDLTARTELVVTGEIGQLAAAINCLAEELERAAALQDETNTARRDLLAAISHDLRTPLASLRAMIEAITDGVVTDKSTVERYLLTMRTELGQLSRLVDALFELARIEAGAVRLERERTALEDLLSDTLEGMRVAAQLKGVVLTGATIGEVRPIVVDPTKIQRVLTNLVQNAIQNTPAGGRIHLTVRDLLDRAEVTVCDTGAGIAPDDLPHIFDRFYRSDRARSRDHDGGTGLGLTIARAVVEAHGGTMEAQSTPGQGSVFRFTLPCGDDRTSPTSSF